ncbi:MAG: helix-turn-helix domain-containing protein [Ekhidna sp.]
MYFRFFPNGIELAITPLIYFYVKSLINPNFRFKSHYWIHFAPFVLAQTYAFIVYFNTLTTYDLTEKDSIAKSFLFNDVKQFEEYLLMISIVLYLFYGYREIMAYKDWLRKTISDSTFPNFNWLITIFRLFIIVGIIKLLNHSFDIFFELNNITTIHSDFLTLVIAILVYYLGFKGYLQPDYTFSRSELFVDNTPTPILSDSKTTATLDLLLKAMKEDKVFLRPKLTIYELSNITGTHQRDLSQIINQSFKLNFREFVNSHRVEEVKSKLIDINYKHMSILGIALECGFNSEASFYRIFKKNTGLSPKEFLEQQNSK